MKRFVYILVSLMIINSANGGVVDIMITGLNGQPINPTKEITVMPSDIATLSIMWVAPDTEYLFSLGTVIGVQGLGTLDFTQTVRHAVFDSSLERKGPDWLVEAANVSLVPGLGPQGEGQPVTAVGNILIHCVGPVSVLVSLSDYALNPTFAVDAMGSIVPTSYGDPVIINQIPEPMALILLGLGGLFVARRKK